MFFIHYFFLLFRHRLCPRRRPVNEVVLAECVEEGQVVVVVAWTGQMCWNGGRCCDGGGRGGGKGM